MGDTRRLVVGAAVLRDGCLLAARRTAPPEAAGRWELPGGKVEPGESPDRALVREIHEELDCRVEVTHWLPERAPIGDRHELGVAVCTLVDGEPRPSEHDLLRWLTPEQTPALDWLEPDRPFLPALIERQLDGSPLDGGNVGDVVRIGDTVRRPIGHWTPAVHALLAHLAGTPGVPAVLGRDARGREIVEFLPGEVIDVDTELLALPRLRSLAGWARRFHRDVAGFRHDGPWRMPSQAREASLIGHNDLAPYNVAFAGDEVAGVFDWDFAGPTTPGLELAHLAWNAVPLFRPIPDDLAAQRLQALADGYGDVTALEVLGLVGERFRTNVRQLRAAMADGDTSLDGLAAAGEPDWTEARLDALVRRLPAIRAHLIGETGPMTGIHAILFDADDAAAMAARLRRDGFSAEVVRERLSGEDDDEDHPWAVLSDAPDLVLELLVDEFDGWLDVPESTTAVAPPLDLPTAPKRIKRP